VRFGWTLQTNFVFPLAECFGFKENKLPGTALDLANNCSPNSLRPLHSPTNSRFMYVAFDQLPPDAQVWIYQASRPLSGAEIMPLLPVLANFAEEWTSHGRSLLASAEFLHQQFLVVGLDETMAGASGCSIDASVRFVAQLEQTLGVQLLEKSRLAFLEAGAVHTLKLAELKAAVAAGTVRPDTFYFDNTVATKSELDTHWPRPAAETWLARYFAKEEKNPALA
jgi:hypothetical protein